MLEEYKTISLENSTEFIIERSKFISYIKHCEDEKEAKTFIESVKKKNYDATHNCYGYITDILGNEKRYFDDGEPSGTAGLPILETISQMNLRQVAVVVTRYFGGIKLGAGGLTRAYSKASSNVINASIITTKHLAINFHFSLTYDKLPLFQNFMKNRVEEIKTINYLDNVLINMISKNSDFENTCREFINFFQGNIHIVKDLEEFYEFKK